MSDVPKNLRNLVVTTASGKDVKQTSQLKGEAKVSTAERQSNETKEYVSGASGKGSGPWGGEHSGA